MKTGGEWALLSPGGTYHKLSEPNFFVGREDNMDLTLKVRDLFSGEYFIRFACNGITRGAAGGNVVIIKFFFAKLIVSGHYFDFCTLS